MNLFNYIIESKIFNLFETIDTNINIKMINESTKSSIIRQLIEQMAKRNNETKHDYWAKTPVFKDLFNRFNIKWSEVEDSDFEIVENVPENESNKEKIKARKEIEKRVKSVIKYYSTNAEAVILLKPSGSDKFTYVFSPQGRLYDIDRGIEVKGNGRQALSQSAKMDLLNGNDIYFLDLTDKINRNEIRKERARTKSGIINPRDPWEMEQLARQNIERYNEIIAKNKATRSIQNDTIAEEVNELLQMAMSITEKFNKDVIKYATLSFKINSILSLIYEKRSYHKSSTGIGDDGIMVLFARYLSSKSYTMNDKQNIAYHQKEMQKYRLELEKQMEKLYELCEEVNRQM